MSIHEKIKELRIKKGLSQEELADMVGYTNRSTIARIENGGIDLSQSKIKAFADALNTTPSYLLESDEEQNEPIVVRMTRAVPIYGSIPAGTPYEAIENIIGEVQIPDHLADTEKLFALKIDGDSMNMVIPDGYIGVFEKTHELRSGQIGAVYVNGYDATVKKFYNLKDNILLEPLSYNPEHEPMIFKKNDPDNPVVIIGKLVWACAPLGYDFR